MASGWILSNGYRFERNVRLYFQEERPRPDLTRLAALERHLNPGTDVSDRPNRSAQKRPPEGEPIGPTIHESSDSPKTDLVENDRPRSFRTRIFPSVTGFLLAALIGAGVALAWQSHGEAAKQMVRTQAPSLAWLFAASTA